MATSQLSPERALEAANYSSELTGCASSSRAAGPPNCPNAFDSLPQQRLHLVPVILNVLRKEPPVCELLRGRFV